MMGRLVASPQVKYSTPYKEELGDSLFGNSLMLIFAYEVYDGSVL